MEEADSPPRHRQQWVGRFFPLGWQCRPGGMCERAVGGGAVGRAVVGQRNTCVLCRQFDAISENELVYSKLIHVSREE